MIISFLMMASVLADSVPMELPSCCGFEWIPYSDDAVLQQSAANIICADVSVTLSEFTRNESLTARCNCKALARASNSNACYSASNATWISGTGCVSSGCPQGTRMYVKSSQLTNCSDSLYPHVELRLADTGCQGEYCHPKKARRITVQSATYLGAPSVIWTSQVASCVTWISSPSTITPASSNARLATPRTSILADVMVRRLTMIRQE